MKGMPLLSMKPIIHWKEFLSSFFVIGTVWKLFTYEKPHWLLEQCELRQAMPNQYKESIFQRRSALLLQSCSTNLTKKPLRCWMYL
ncbi:hypothetical protein CK203_006187 [Vitis vinifera]|uniref:Uncharacterized protein n=1 Tax=Vitis vinifera TaxID=29760 RepID=A0A438K5Q3_VITVI|nr:hypothetical protein CK203_006187 [Vitis vinifera]